MDFEKFENEKQRLTTALNLAGIKIVMVANYTEGQIYLDNDAEDDGDAISFLGVDDLDRKVSAKLKTEIEYFLQSIIDHHGEGKHFSGGSILWVVKEGVFTHNTYQFVPQESVSWPNQSP